MIDWLLNLVPWWAYLIAAAIALGAVWRILGWQGALVAAAGLLAALGYGKGRADASAADQSERRERDIQSMKTRKETDDEINQMGAADIDERLARWLRDK